MCKTALLRPVNAAFVHPCTSYWFHSEIKNMSRTLICPWMDGSRAMQEQLPRFGGYFLFCCGINSMCSIRVSIWGLGLKLNLGPAPLMPGPHK